MSNYLIGSGRCVKSVENSVENSWISSEVSPLQQKTLRLKINFAYKDVCESVSRWLDCFAQHLCLIDNYYIYTAKKLSSYLDFFVNTPIEQ